MASPKKLTETSSRTLLQRPPLDYELKYIFDNRDSYLVLEWIKTSCIPDPVYPFGIVSSIYFDSRDWRFLREKINSDFIKTKIRIRWYTDEKGKTWDRSFIEIKKKTGTTRNKIRMPCTISGPDLERIDLTAADLLDIRENLLEQGEHIADTLFPAFQIRYKRWRFIEPHTSVRVCVDCDIGVPRVNELIFPKALSFWLENGVFEVKGPIDELPDVLQRLIMMGCRRESFSKYSTCFERLIQSERIHLSTENPCTPHRIIKSRQKNTPDVFLGILPHG